MLILVELFTITQWVEVRGDICWYWWNCWYHSMSWCERWFLLILVELLTSLNELRWEVIFLILGELFTITQWVKMRGWFLLILVELLISLNELRWELIFVDIGGIVDITQWVEVIGDCFWYWWKWLPSLNEFRWEVIFDDIGGIVYHHSMSWCDRWLFLILVEMITITQWV